MKFSVLMSVYKNDKSEYLIKSINSIYEDQTLKPSEIVLVVDGEVPEEIEQVIKKYENDKIFKIVRLEKNSGLGIALREGLKHCTNNIIARMDADDISVPNRFEIQIKEFEKDKNLSIVGGYIQEFINDTENKISIREVPLTDNEIKKYIKKRCPLNHMTVMFKKEDVEKAGSYEQWFYNEDYYLWLRMYLNNCTFKNIGEILVFARVGKEMYQRRGGYKYFKSGFRTQKFMYKNKIISFPRYIVNNIERFVIQVICPNRLRAFAYKHFARKENAFENEEKY